jgi:hypothetical protein
LLEIHGIDEINCEMKEGDTKNSDTKRMQGLGELIFGMGGQPRISTLGIAGGYVSRSGAVLARLWVWCFVTSWGRSRAILWALRDGH